MTLAEQRPTNSSATRYALWAIFACLVWSSAFPAVKIGLADVPPLRFAGWRFMLAGLMLMPLCGHPSRFLQQVWRHRRVIVPVALLQTVVLYGLFFLGMDRVSGAKGAILIGSSPLINAIAAHWLMRDDRMSWRQGGSITLGMLGVIVLAVGDDLSELRTVKTVELIGLGILMIGTLSSAFAGIVVARQTEPMNPIVLNSAQMFSGGVVLSLIALAVHNEPMVCPPAKFFGVLVWMAVISAVGFTIWFALLKHVKVSVLNMWKFIIPVFGAIFSWFRPEEFPTVTTVVGMVCVAAAVLLNQWQAARVKADE